MASRPEYLDLGHGITATSPGNDRQNPEKEKQVHVQTLDLAKAHRRSLFFTAR